MVTRWENQSYGDIGRALFRGQALGADSILLLMVTDSGGCLGAMPENSGDADVRFGRDGAR
jgi:hypothetical protein